jgi:hypothetical protein
VCTIVSNVATLDTRLGGTSGVYYVGSSGKSFYGQRLSQIGALSFTYSGTLGVDPHWSVPIDTDGDGNTDLYALVPSNTCTNGSGLVDVIKDTTCEIFRTDNTTASYPNWDAFVVAVGLNAKVSLVDKTASVIADRGLGLWTVSNVVVGKPGK